MRAAAGHKSPALEPALAEVAEGSITGNEREAASKASKRPAHREGHVHIGAWLPADFAKNILMVRGRRKTPITSRELIAEALNRIFEAEGLPPIDLD